MFNKRRGSVGTTRHFPDEQYERVDWKIENFFSLSDVCGQYYDSPEFDFAETSWCLRLYTNGQTESIGWIKLYLKLIDPRAERHIHYTCGVQTAEGNLEEWFTYFSTFKNPHSIWGSHTAIRRSELLLRKLELAPLECLTVTVIMSTVVPPLLRDTVDASVQTGCKGAKIIKGGSQPWEKEGAEKVAEDMEKLLVSGDQSDVIVQVGDVQFNAHMIILAARTPVLAATFRCETAEKISNKISISDCEPDIFKEFLHYIYAGTVQHLTAQNVFSLYRVADKYLTYDLKSQCLIYIQDTLCVETFCDTVQLALKHEEGELLRLATDFATKNIRLIIRSVEWQNFNREHPTIANDILIKSLGSP